MNFKELVAANRSRRRFDQAQLFRKEDLVDLVDTARLMPSGMNKQPLKYHVTVDPTECSEIFPLLGWAGYLKDWPGPNEGERPTGYIVVLLDKTIAEDSHCDQGIASQTIMLGAVEKGLGGCIIATINRKKLGSILGLSDNLEILLVLALGVPIEEVVVDPLSSEGNIKYWRDSVGKHHVPKRELAELLVERNVS